MFLEALTDLLSDPFFAPVQLATLFILGASIGSFLNVCIYRIPHGVSLVKPHSHCYRCGRGVRWYDNIPLLSYWLLRGQCRHCGAGFSMRYFMVELLTALLFVGAALRLGYSLTLVPALLFISLLVVGTFTDIDHWIIPDRITLGGLVAGLALAAVGPIGRAAGNPLAEPPWLAPAWMAWAPGPLFNAAVGAAIGFALLYGLGWLGTLIFRKEAMGFGDVKLFAMFGAFMGATYLLHVLVIACGVGTVVGLVGLLRGRLARNRPPHPAVAPLAPNPDEAERLASEYPLAPGEAGQLRTALAKPGTVGTARHHLPFGPSLAIAALIVYFYGPELSAWFTRVVAPDLVL